MKTVGIIGGLGPNTTSEFYLYITSGYIEKSGGNFPSILLSTIPVSQELEKNLVFKRKDFSGYKDLLINSAKRLEDAGADFLVIPCNSVHIFIEDVKSAVNIPVLNIVEETAKFLSENAINKFVVLSTGAIIEHKLYETHLQRFNLSYKTTPEDYQGALDGIIYRLNNGEIKKDDERTLNEIIDKSLKEYDSVVLGCTDLQLLVDRNRENVFDSMEILANRTIEEMLL